MQINGLPPRARQGLVDAVAAHRRRARATCSSTTSSAAVLRAAAARRADPPGPAGATAPFWSVTRFQDIMAVDTNHADFSSDWQLRRDLVGDAPPARQCRCSSRWTRRGTTSSARRSPDRRAEQSGPARGHDPRAGRATSSTACRVGEPFDWVDRVSIELTTRCWRRCSTSRSRTGGC